MKLQYLLLTFTLLFLSCNDDKLKTNSQPNIILIITDDQGYGDIGAHGNPWIKTPELDKLHNESVRLIDFHTGTTCTPTRAGLLTGRNCNETGAWHTVGGRSLLRLDEVTIADVLKTNGYETAIFGKWHLGDNYPYLPNQRGFATSVIHGGGGVGQTPDYWNNDYFDDTYFRNGNPEKFQGYSTDIWFNEAISFIEKNQTKPFFCYISTNAPHSPFHVPKKYIELYKDNKNIPEPNFYGMITNIDENIGRLRNYLNDKNLSNNTIFIFMTDNGTSGGAILNDKGFLEKGYNAGMRGKKVSPYEGGHRVPFFIHWPFGNLAHGNDVKYITSYTDIMPTILSLCKINYKSKLPFEGESIASLLENPNSKWKKRTIITDTQRGPFMIKGKMSSVMTDKHRLVNGDELYDYINDPGQKENISKKFPEKVKELNNEYERWWKRVSERKDEFCPIPVGYNNDYVKLTSHDIHVKDNVYAAWHQEAVRLDKNVTGYWNIDVQNEGEYEISIYRYPKETDYKFDESIPKGEEISGGKALSKGVAINVKEIRIKIGDIFKILKGNKSNYSSILKLKAGQNNLSVRVIDINQKEREAYFVYLKKL